MTRGPVRRSPALCHGSRDCVTCITRVCCRRVSGPCSRRDIYCAATGEEQNTAHSAPLSPLLAHTHIGKHLDQASIWLPNNQYVFCSKKNLLWAFSSELLLFFPHYNIYTRVKCGTWRALSLNSLRQHGLVVTMINMFMVVVVMFIICPLISTESPDINFNTTYHSK